MKTIKQSRWQQKANDLLKDSMKQRNGRGPCGQGVFYEPINPRVKLLVKI